MFMEIIACFSVIFFLLFVYENQNEDKQPPGPWRIPCIGNMLQIVRAHPIESHVAFHKLSKIYGPIMNIKLGWRKVVVLTSYEDMKELLPLDEFSGRVCDSYLFDRAFGKELGILFSNGKTWDTMRKFTVKTLREFGFGKTASMQTALNDEATYLIDFLDQKIKENNGKISMEGFFPLSILNILWSMVLGKRYELDDKKIKDLIQLNERAFLAGSFGANLSFAFPSIRNIPPFKQLFQHDIILKLFDEIHQYMRDCLTERRLAGEYKQEPNNFVDHFLYQIDKESKNAETHSVPKDVLYTDEQFILVSMDLFQAGSETVAGTLNFAILWLSLYPQVQKKVQNEIDKIFAQGTPTLDDEHLMDYTRATILEIQRISAVVPLVPPRKVLKDYHYHGYHFKKDTAILVNFYSVFMDEKYWKDPTVFRPERFIGHDGKCKVDERLVFFGLGKRTCFGDVLAKAELFIFLVSLLQVFKFELVPDQPPPTTVPAVGFTLRPKPYQVIVKRRRFH